MARFRGHKQLLGLGDRRHQNRRRASELRSVKNLGLRSHYQIRIRWNDAELRAVSVTDSHRRS